MSDFSVSGDDAVFAEEGQFAILAVDDPLVGDFAVGAQRDLLAAGVAGDTFGFAAARQHQQGKELA